MSRRPRVNTGGFPYHVLNRAVGRGLLFNKPADYESFEKALAQTHDRLPVRIASYCLMPNHWHLVLWPQGDGDLSEFMRLLICAHCGRVVTGEMKHKTSPNGTKRLYSYYHCSGYSTGEHPKFRLTETEIDRQLLALFATIRIDDAEIRQWFIDVIRARAGQAENKQHRVELKRQHEHIEAKLSTLLSMRVEGKITQEEYAGKRSELHDRQSALRLQLEGTDRDDREVADSAIKAFELSQSLTERWVKSDYNAKRTILSIMLEIVRLNCENLEFSLRKPFDLPRDQKLVPLSGAMGI